MSDFKKLDVSETQNSLDKSDVQIHERNQMSNFKKLTISETQNS